MSTADRKKQHERFLLERFIEASGLAVQIVKEREEPDFLVRFEERLIGIEVTQLFVSHVANGPLPQAQESISDKIVCRARQIYEATGAPPAHVSVCFASGHELRQIDRDGTAKLLASFVSGLNLSAWERADWRPGYPGPLPFEIAFVHALGVPASEMAHWTVARAGWVAPVSVDALQSRVDEKAARLPKYQESVEENWLLVVADGMKPSQLFEVRPEFEAHKVASPFARTYFYAHPDRAIVELGKGGGRDKRQPGGTV